MPSATFNPPIALKWKAKLRSYYTLMCTDPDVYSQANPNMTEVRHWFVGNIPSSDISKGQVLASYAGPAPFLNSGFHRYIFLVYEQLGRLQFQENPILHDM